MLIFPVLGKMTHMSNIVWIWTVQFKYFRFLGISIFHPTILGKIRWKYTSVSRPAEERLRDAWCRLLPPSHSPKQWMTVFQGTTVCTCTVLCYLLRVWRWYRGRYSTQHNVQCNEWDNYRIIGEKMSVKQLKSTPLLWNRTAASLFSTFELGGCHCHQVSHFLWYLQLFCI